jgi:hypothetical protein
MPRAARSSPIARGVGYGAGQAVEFRYDEGVAGPDGGQRLVETGTGAVGTRELVVEVDPLR